MARQVYVHIGAPKSGTTYLQSLMWTNRDRLAEAGLLLPGTIQFDHNRIAQAVRFSTPDANAHKAWYSFLDEIKAWPGDVVLSNEWFCLTSQAQVGRFVDALWPAEVHVVATARDLVRTVPSAWQEALKLGHSTSLIDFIGSLDRNVSRWRWSTLDPSLALPRWQASVPRGNVHVVTVAPPGGPRALLWNRFTEVLGIDPTGHDLETHLANESLGAESARLLEILGPRLRDAVDADAMPWNHVYRWVKDGLSNEVIVPLGGSPIGLDAEEHAALRRRSHDSARRLRSGGYHVVGCLDDLVTADLPSDAVRPDDVSDSAMFELTQELVVRLLRRWRDASVRADRATRRADALQKRLDDPAQGRTPRLANRLRARR